MYLLCMIKARIRWCTCRVENILTLVKLLSLWICFLLHSILFFISQTAYRTYKIILNYELARPVMGTIFLVYICLWTKNFESYFSDRLTLSYIRGRTSRQIYRLALPLLSPETLSSLSKLYLMHTLLYLFEGWHNYSRSIPLVSIVI